MPLIAAGGEFLVSPNIGQDVEAGSHYEGDRKNAIRPKMNA